MVAEGEDNNSKRASGESEDALNDAYKSSGKAATNSIGAIREGDDKKQYSSMQVEDITSAPPKMHHILFENLHRLATMPRKRQSDFAQNALWAAIATIPGAWSGWHDINFPKPTQPIPLDVIEIVVFSICCALVLVGYVGNRSIETAEEYLNRLCMIQKTENQFLKWCKGKVPWLKEP